MDFSIFSVGSAEFLEQIFIALAMISGTNDFEKLCAVGMLLGILLMAFQSIFQNAKAIEWQQIFGCWVIYFIAFGVSTTVTIEDSREHDVRVVSNVPLGPVAVGSILSNVGYGITEMFEIAYSPVAPGITEKKFISSLELLTSLRSTRMQAALWNSFDDSMGGGKVNMERTVLNYIADCTATKFIKNEISASEINTLNWREALKYESNFTTETFVYAAGAVTMTCTDAWSSITTAIDSTFHDVRSQQVLQFMLESDDAIDATSDALNNLAASSVAASEYIKANIMAPMYSKGFAQFYSNTNDPYASITMFDAESKRNSQWGAEQQLFTNSITSMMTIIEGFVYAITPFAAFIMVMGSKGVVMVGKYLQMLVWIQLWLPILSIVNLFIYTKGQAVLERYMTLGDLTSYESVVQVSAELERWIGIGSMMAASTPALAFFLVSGSSVAFNSMAQRMTSGNTVNPSTMSPDTLDRGPMMNQKMGFDQDAFGGTTAQGAALESVSIGSQTSATAASAKSETASSQRAYASAIKEAIGREVGSGSVGAMTKQAGDQVLSSDSKLNSWATKQAESFTNSFSNSKGHEEDVSRILALAASGQISAGVAGQLLGELANSGASGGEAGPPVKGSASVGASGSVSLNSGNRDKRSISQSDISNWMNSHEANASETSQWSKTATDSLTNSQTLQQSDAFKDSNLQEKSSQFQRAKGRQESFSELSQAMRSAGIQDSMKISQVGGMLAGNSALNDAYNNNLMNNQGLKDAYGSYFTRFKGGGSSDGQADAMAKFMALTNQGNYNSTSDYIDGSQGALTALAATRGVNFSGSDPYANQGVGSGAVKGRDSVNAPTSPNYGDIGSIDESRTKGNHANGASALKSSGSASEAGINPVSEKMSKFTNSFESGSGFETNLAARLSGANDGIGRWVNNAVAANSVSQEALQNMNPQELQEYASKMDGYMSNIQDGSIAGDLKRHAAESGLTLLGAVAAQAAKLPYSGAEKPEGMSERDYAAFQLTAASMAQFVGQAGADERLSQMREQFYGVMEQEGIREHGLSPAEAKYYAASHAYGLEGLGQSIAPDAMNVNSDRRLQALESMRAEHASFGADDRYTNAVAGTIDDAADAGKWGGGYMGQITEINRSRNGIY